MIHSRIAGKCWLALCIGIVLLAAAGATAHAADSRYILASQYDWGSKHGFYLEFENSSPNDNPCPLPAMKLALGVGDGANWHFLINNPAWQYNEDYTVKAQVAPNGSQLWLNGIHTQQNGGGFAPDASDFTADSTPGWATATTGYQVVEESLKVTCSSAKDLQFTFPMPSAKTISLSLLGQSLNGKTVPGWHPSPTDTITIEATFRIIPKPTWQSIAPMIDRYGQCVYADWPGKIKNDAQIDQAAKAENKQLAAWSATKEFDKYGGFLKAGWKDKATGFYRLAKRNGAWWLITPLGNPCFYTGICNAPLALGDVTPVAGREQLFAYLPPKTGPFAAAWTGGWGAAGGTGFVGFSAVTEIRTEGANWKNDEARLAARRMHAWGFSGIGKWDSLSDAPSIPVLEHGDVPNIGRHPDIFNPDVQSTLQDTLRKQIDPRKNDPNVVGWSLGNEYDEIITPDEITTILSKDEHTPAKRALVDYALKSLYKGDIDKMASAWKVQASLPEQFYPKTPTPPAADLEALRHYYAEQYYGFIYKTVKSIDPNHLYLGFWIVPNWWVNESDWSLIAPYCDVIGYDRYASQFADASFAHLIRSTDKPILCGEFSFPPNYNNTRAFGTYPAISVGTDAQAGDDYIQWVKDASKNPDCVGVCWFEYRDEPITGRGPDMGPGLVYGEHYAFGLVDVTGRAKEDLVTRVRQANLAAPEWRLHASP